MKKALLVVVALLIMLGVGIVLSFSDSVSTDMSGADGSLTVYLIDKDGNAIRVLNPSSPLAILPLSFVYNGQEFAYIKAVANVKINTSVQYWYTAKLHVEVYKWVSSGWGYWDKIAEDTLTRDNNADQPTQTDTLMIDFNIYPSSYISNPQDGDQYKMRLWAEIDLEGVNGLTAHGTTNGAVAIQFEYQETQWLEIVSITIEPNPQP